MLAVATCTGGVSCDCLCDESCNATATIGFGSSGAAVVAVCVTGSAAVATCTGGVSSDCFCDESGNATATIGFGSSGAAVVAVCVTGSAAIATCTDGVSSDCFGDAASTRGSGLSGAAVGSAAVATSTLATTALFVAVASRASATSAPAVRVAAQRSAAGPVPALSTPPELRTINEPTAQIARTNVPHTATATFEDRRGSMIPSPPKVPPQLCGTAQACNGADLSKQDCGRATTVPARHHFFQIVLPDCIASPGTNGLLRPREFAKN